MTRALDGQVIGQCVERSAVLPVQHALPSMVAAHDLEQPSMDLATLARAVEIALLRISLEGRG